MPPTRTAALVTDAYRRRIVALRDATAEQIAVLLAQIDLDVTPASLALQLDRWRRRAERATQGAAERAADQSIAYLSTYLVASGASPVSVPLAPVVIGAPALATGRSALLWRLGQGAGRPVAVATATAMARRATRDVIGQSANRTLAEGIRREPQIDGWHRATSGTCCRRCADLSGTRYRDRDAFDPAHPACRCSPEPTVLGRAEALRRRPPDVVVR